MGVGEEPCSVLSYSPTCTLLVVKVLLGFVLFMYSL